MYSEADSIRQAYFIKQYIEDHPNCTRKDIIQNCVTNAHRIARLERQGFIKLPKPLPFGERNGLFRKGS